MWVNNEFYVEDNVQVFAVLRMRCPKQRESEHSPESILAYPGQQEREACAGVERRERSFRGVHL